MKKEIADQWIAALRSGEYQQGQNQLRTGDKFCCLGVLAEISKQGTWTSICYLCNENDHHSTILPYTVTAWAGLKHQNPYIIIDGLGMITLASMNDKGKSFADIANVIEKYWETI